MTATPSAATGAGRASALAALAALLALAAPAASSADHVDITARVGARLVERGSGQSWRVNVSYLITCIGVPPEAATYNGNLSLVDARTGERIYLGGVFDASGTVRQIVSSRSYWRYLTATLEANCGGDHGSPTIEVTGGGVEIPPIGGDRESGSGGSGGGGGSSGGADPTRPPRAGGCRSAIVGTNGPDKLVGSAAGDVVFGRGGERRAARRGR